MNRFILQIYYDEIFEEIDLENYNSQKLNIGRNIKNDLVIPSDALIENHACVNISKDSVEFIDLSSGQTYCNNNIFNTRKIIEDNDIYLFFNPLNLSRKAIVIFRDKLKIQGKIIKYDIKDCRIITIGRDGKNNISFKNKLVSAEHAIIEQLNNNYFLDDCESKNGTYLNGRLIKRSILKSGDIVIIGGHKIVFNDNIIKIEFVDNIVFIRELKEIKEIAINYPYVSRSPRLEPAIPFEEIDIPNPPSQSSKPTISWLAVLLPPIGIIAAMAVIGVVMWKSTQSPWIIIGTSMMSFMSLIVSVVTYMSQKKKFVSDENKRKSIYIDALKSRENEIEGLKINQKKVLNTIHPDTRQCFNIVEKKGRQLWARSPIHSDFLYVRVGYGDLPLNLKINVPKFNIQIDQDPLQKEATRFIESYKYLEDAPVCVPVLGAGVSGIIGRRDLILQSARNLIIQIATHHAYNEVKIVFVYNKDEKDAWSWVRWLPHVWDNEKNIRFIADSREGVHRLFNHLYEIIRFRETSLIEESKDDAKLKIPYYVFFIADKTIVENEILMEYLMHNNQKLGVSSIFLFNNLQNLPQDCIYIINMEYNKGSLIDKNNTSRPSVFIPDSASVEDSEKFARLISPLRIKEIVSSVNLPASVTFLDLYGVKNVEELDILKRWKSNSAYKSLSALIGLKTGNQNISLDIHERFHGPHGLVAGTTGSGKSELLQSYILSLSINYHPHDVSFLLIDYKGGGMAHLFRDLPHLSGIITNLSGNQTNRALTSIKSEIKKRQRIFDEKNLNHIDKYNLLYKSGGVKEPLPHLIIIVDEFAELKAEQPDFMSELVSTARVGRSLGIHLILATQKPSGVVDDQIWGNAKFRICLKVQDVQDSREVIKRSDAAQITLPGRAYIQIGNNEIFELFQAAYSGSEYNPLNIRDGDLHENSNISKVLLEGDRVLFQSSIEGFDFSDTKIFSCTKNINQLQAVIEKISGIYIEEKIPKLPALWIPPLPENIFLGELLKKDNKNIGWNGKNWQNLTVGLPPVVGLVDDPENRLQHALTLDFTKEGNIVIYGGPGAGKTTFLQTLIMSLMLTRSPEDINIYIMDFGSGILNVFANFPHVGGFLMVDESIKLQKLMRFLFKEIEKRKNVFTSNGVGNFTAYRQSDKRDIPEIFIIVDNFAAVSELYPDVQEQFVQISREGTNMGIYLVLTANNVLNIGYKINNNINMAVALQMPDKGAYSDVVGSTFGLAPESFKGRGLIKNKTPLEFQTALPIEGETEAERTLNIRKLSDEMANRWQGRIAKPIPIMPEILLYYDLLKKPGIDLKNQLAIPIGLDFEDLDVQSLNLKNDAHYLITGKTQSGKSNFLKIILKYITENLSEQDMDIYLVDSFLKRELMDFCQNKKIKAYSNNPKSNNKLLSQLKIELDSRKNLLNKQAKKTKKVKDNSENGLNFTPIILLIDDYKDFVNELSEDKLEYFSNIIIRERLLSFHIIMSGLFEDINYSYDSLVKSLKSTQCGLLLSELSEQQIYNIRVKYSDTSEILKPGEGYQINRKGYKKIKTALIKQ